jgi:hypothetical protein
MAKKKATLRLAVTKPENKIMSTIFFSQNLLDALIEEGRIKIDHNIMTLLTKEQHSFALEPAYRVVRTIAGSADTYQLLGAIKTEQELKNLNAEAYQNSIIIGSIGYEAEPGFLGDEQTVMEKLSDTDLLARFLLENML